MNDKINEYIEEEKEFSKFKIKTLERATSKHKDRLINKEREFLDFDFGSINFSSIEECRSSIDLFKVSKSQFMLKHNLATKISVNDARINFLKKKSDDLAITGIGEIDNFKFKALKSKNIYRVDGEVRSVYSKLICLCKSLIMILSDYIRDSSEIPHDIDEIFQNIDFSKKTYGEYFDSNIMSLPEDMFDSIVHKTDKTSLLVFKMPHNSNEKINIIGCKMKSVTGDIISPKKLKFANCNISGSYYKSIVLDKDVAENADFSSSLVFVGKSRRFMEHFSEARLWLKLIRLHLEEIF